MYIALHTLDCCVNASYHYHCNLLDRNSLSFLLSQRSSVDADTSKGFSSFPSVNHVDWFQMGPQRWETEGAVASSPTWPSLAMAPWHPPSLPTVIVSDLSCSSSTQSPLVHLSRPSSE